MNLKTPFVCLLALALCWSPAWAQNNQAPEPAGEFTSAAAKAAQSRYAAAAADAQQKYVFVLKQLLADNMRAGQLDESNKLSKVIEDVSGSNIPLTSLRGKAAQESYHSAMQRAGRQYQGELKLAMSQSLQASQLEEANRIGAELKRIETGNVRQADAVTGFINLLPQIHPETDALGGKWSLEKGGLLSSGEGEEKLQIPYRPPAEYDFKITFTKLSGSNCVIQIMAHEKSEFIWVMSPGGSYTFHYLKGAGIGRNKTSVTVPPGIKTNDKHTSIIRVRKDGVEAYLDGKLLTKWKTDYSDVSDAPFWRLKDRSLLGLATGDARTLFHSIEVKEVTGAGTFTR